MKFSLISDMHVNHPQPKTPYHLLEEVVVVAGDTDNGLGGLKFLNKIRNKGHTVFAVDGNHEHYSNLSSGRTWIETRDRFQEEFPPSGVLPDDTPIVLANGWYNVQDHDKWYDYMNDGQYSRLRGDTVTAIAINDAEFVRNYLEYWRKKQLRGVVVTHTAPCTETLDQRFYGDLSNEWYWSPRMHRLIEEYSDVIAVWCHGHTHAKADKIINGVRVVCNPRGYPGENPDWSPMTIEI